MTAIGVYGSRLLQSGLEAADRPCFEDHVDDPRSLSPSERLMAIYLPLATAEEKVA